MINARTFIVLTVVLLGLVLSSAQRTDAQGYVYTINGNPVSPTEYKAAILYNEARTLFDAGHLEAAKEKLEAVLQLNEHDGEARTKLGYVLDKLGQVKEATREYKLALQLGANSPELYLNLGSISQQSGKLQEAIAYLNEYLARYPGDVAYSQAASLNSDIKEQLSRWQHVSQLPGANSNRDYFAYATAKHGVLHWPASKGKIKVYSEPAVAVQGYRSSLGNTLKKSFQRWSAASAGKVQFEFITDRSAADIVCQWVDSPAALKSSAEGGEARLQFSLQGIRHVDILVLTMDNLTGKPISDVEIESTCLHEIGHAIGLSDHSPNPNDIMYFSLTAKHEISARDVETLRMIYATEISQLPLKEFNPEPELQNTLQHNGWVNVYNSAVDAYNEHQYNRAIELAEEALCLDTDCDDPKEIIEGACNKLAEDLNSSRNYIGAEWYLNKALSLTFKNRAKSHRSITLRNYALVLRNLHDDAKASQYEAQIENEREVEGGIASMP